MALDKRWGQRGDGRGGGAVVQRRNRHVIPWLLAWEGSGGGALGIGEGLGDSLEGLIEMTTLLNGTERC